MEAQNMATAARLAALRYQLNPHFLFNTLNAVSSAVVNHRIEEAETMLSRLADFLRVTLAADPQAMIPLEDELETLQAYLAIEGERFRDRLGVRFVCPDRLLQALVPSFLLQPLVENSIKHGVSRTTRTVTLRVEAMQDGDDLVVIVEDDGGGRATERPAPGSGVGLENVRQRLEVLYGSRGALQATPRERGYLAMIRLPLTLQSDPAIAA
jgi:LytS/YehU family sensor histidine kinase